MPATDAEALSLRFSLLRGKRNSLDKVLIVGQRIQLDAHPLKMQHPQSGVAVSRKRSSASSDWAHTSTSSSVISLIRSEW